MAHHCDSVRVEEGAGHVGGRDEGADLERVVVSVFVQLRLEALVVKVAILCHGYQYNIGTCLPPRDQVGVVLEH